MRRRHRAQPPHTGQAVPSAGLPRTKTMTTGYSAHAIATSDAAHGRVGVRDDIGQLQADLSKHVQGDPVLRLMSQAHNRPAIRLETSQGSMRIVLMVPRNGSGFFRMRARPKPKGMAMAVVSRTKTIEFQMDFSPFRPTRYRSSWKAQQMSRVGDSPTEHALKNGEAQGNKGTNATKRNAGRKKAYG